MKISIKNLSIFKNNTIFCKKIHYFHKDQNSFQKLNFSEFVIKNVYLEINYTHK